jgi:type I restriction enzyme, S subunit
MEAVQQTQVRSGQFIISKIDARNGACGFIPPGLDGAVVSNDFPVFDIVGAEPRYLDHLVALPVFWHLCEAVSDGSTNRVRLDLDQFDELLFPIPPMAEQRGIATVLDSIDDAIARAESAAATTEALRQAVLHDLLARGVPGQHAEWTSVPGLGVVPTSWRTSTLGALGRWTAGGTPSKARDEYWRGTVPWISPKDMKVPEIWDATDHISEAGASAGSSLADPGAILVVVRGMILAHSFPIALLRVRCAFNQDIRALTCGPGIVPEYIVLALEAQRSALVDLATPSTHGTMRVVLDSLLCRPIALPPSGEQAQIVAAIQSVREKVACERALVRALRSVKSAIGAALLSGRLRTQVGPAGDSEQ